MKLIIEFAFQYRWQLNITQLQSNDVISNLLKIMWKYCRYLMNGHKEVKYFLTVVWVFSLLGQCSRYPSSTVFLNLLLNLVIKTPYLSKLCLSLVMMFLASSPTHSFRSSWPIRKSPFSVSFIFFFSFVTKSSAIWGFTMVKLSFMTWSEKQEHRGY